MSWYHSKRTLHGTHLPLLWSNLHSHLIQSPPEVLSLSSLCSPAEPERSLPAKVTNNDQTLLKNSMKLFVFIQSANVSNPNNPISQNWQKQRHSLPLTRVPPAPPSRPPCFHRPRTHLDPPWPSFEREDLFKDSFVWKTKSHLLMPCSYALSRSVTGSCLICHILL